MRLRVDPRDGAVRLTLPHRASAARALKWAAGQRAWVEAQLEQLPAMRPIIDGSTLPFRGEEQRITWDMTLPRRPEQSAGVIRIGGEKAELQNRVIRWMKDHARRDLQRASDFYAAEAGVDIAKISIGDARTRWGSCSSSGRIRYNWRLIMAPRDVLNSVAAHEVAHRVHMHHGPEFHAEVARIFGREPHVENRWLREHGTALYWIGCSS